MRDTAPGSDILARLDAARATAEAGSIPLRRTDAALYATLAECLGICEDVIRDGLEKDLRGAVRVSVDFRNPELKGRSNSNNGRGRRYAETGSDAFILVCRYVLAGRDNRNSYYRYATTLREAAKRQIGSGSLVAWLTENGGVRALYLRRPGLEETMERRTLHLNSPVTFLKSAPFNLTLKYDGKGFFDVVPT